MLAIASYVKRRGGEDAPEYQRPRQPHPRAGYHAQLAGVIDLVNISLNAPDKMMYDRLCRPVYRDVAFDSVLIFARDCKKSGVCCRFSVVRLHREGVRRKVPSACRPRGYPFIRQRNDPQWITRRSFLELTRNGQRKITSEGRKTVFARSFRPSCSLVRQVFPATTAWAGSRPSCEEKYG